ESVGFAMALFYADLLTRGLLQRTGFLGACYGKLLSDSALFYPRSSMFKSGIPELVLFFDLEWVPDASAAKRLYDLPDDVTEIEAMQALWQKAGATPENPRPFIKYLYSRVVSIAFLSRKRVYQDNEPTVEFTLNSLP